MITLTERPTTRFEAPPEAFAPAPAEARGLRRGETRLLVARPDGVTHARFTDLADHLRPGDLVVVNDSATVAGQVDAVSSRHGAVVVHHATTLDESAPTRGPGLEPGRHVIELRTAPDARRAILDAEPGDVLTLDDGPRLRLVAPWPAEASSPTGHGNRLWRAALEGPDAAPAVVRDHLARHGRPIAYGYLERRYPLEDYQTIFATRPGSAEMPSAARPFTTDLVTRLVARGVGVVPVTLHTGVSSQEAGEAPGPEWFEVPPATARLIAAARAGGGRIVAVGTTVTRALESAVDPDDPSGRLRAVSGWTDRVVTPARPPRVVDGLVSGWHDPAASHLLLVEAVAGAELAQRAYDAAVASRYLWHEFGDSALFLP